MTCKPSEPCERCQSYFAAKKDLQSPHPAVQAEVDRASAYADGYSDGYRDGKEGVSDG